MNYHLHYDRLIERARNRVLEGYSEKHHIVPRCMGGGNEPSNIVRLTAAEHLFAHELLVKMYPGDHRLLWAAIQMGNGNAKQPGRSRLKVHQWLREKFSKVLSERSKGRKCTEEARAKMSLARRGKKRKPHSAETRAKMSAAAKGKPKSREHAEKSRLSKIGVKQGPRREDWKRNQSIAIKEAMSKMTYEHLRTPEYREKQAARMREIWAERKAQSLNKNTHQSGDL